MAKTATATKAKRSNGEARAAAAKLADPIKIETVSVADLQPHPRNYRTHPEAQLAHIVASLEQHGFYRNVVVARDGTILAGHGVVEAAKKIGFKEVPVIRLDVAPDDPRALKVLMADNELGRFAEDDDRMLVEMLQSLRSDDELGLLGTGYDDQALAALLMVTRPTSEVADFDAAAEWVGMPEYDPGEVLYRLVVQFRSEADRKKFLAEFKLKVTAKKHGGNAADGKTWSTWWPDRAPDDTASLKWAEPE